MSDLKGSISLVTNNTVHLEFKGGKIYILGEEVEDRNKIYEALTNWFVKLNHHNKAMEYVKNRLKELRAEEEIDHDFANFHDGRINAFEEILNFLIEENEFKK